MQGSTWAGGGRFRAFTKLGNAPCPALIPARLLWVQKGPMGPHPPV